MAKTIKKVTRSIPFLVVMGLVIVAAAGFIIIPQISKAVDTVLAPNQTITSNSVSNPDYAWASDNNRATFNNNNDYADYGFASFGISADSTIDGIEVTVEGRKTSSRNLTVALWNASDSDPDTYTITNTATLSTSSSDNTSTLGGPTDKWGKTWTVADFADSTFKIRVQATSGNGDALLDQVRVKIYYTEAKPDLTVTKTHAPSGDAFVGTPFNWVLTITNSGNATATFSNNNVVLTDNLPNTSPIPTYGTPSIAFAGGASGAGTTCSISSQTLTCTSHNSGGNVIFPVSGTMTVTIPVTPTGTGTLANPRSTNGCKVDPASTNGAIPESNEGNNTCADTVTVSQYIAPNYTLPQTCGLDIALLADVSTSIDSGEMSNLKGALTTFANAFSGTPTVFSLSKFGTLGTVMNPFSMTPAQAVTAISGLAVSGSTQYTNWDDALTKAYGTFDPRTANPNLLIIATDGNPNKYGNPATPSGSSLDEPSAIAAAITRANAIKSASGSAKARILAVGIGTDLNVDNLKAISGNNVNTGATSDVITSNFNTLANDLAGLANDLCGGTITVKKTIDGIATAGWGYTASATGGTPNPATDTTGDDGFAQFKINNIDGATASVNVTETVKPGYEIASASCTKNRAPVGTFDGIDGVNGIVIGHNDIVSCVFDNTLAPFCGDSNVDENLGEQCDQGPDGGSACTSECTWKPATITLNKIVNNTHGGDAKPENFNLTIDDVTVIQGVAQEVTANVAHTINEGSLTGTGYTFSSITGEGCPTELGGSVTPTHGQNIACTITNNDLAADVKISKAVTVNGATQSSANEGDTLKYTISLNNTTAGFMDGLIVTDKVPQYSTLVDGSILPSANSSIDTSTSIITWNNIVIGPNETLTFSFEAKVNSGLPSGATTSIKNTANVKNACQTESAIGCFNQNSLEVKTDVTKAAVIVPTTPVVLGAETPTLTITKAVSTPFANPGNTVTYTVVVTNTSTTATATNVVLTDTLPTGFIFVDTKSTSATWNLGDILPTKSVTKTYEVKLDNALVAGKYLNSATVKADSVNPVGAQATLDVRQVQVLGAEDEIKVLGAELPDTSGGSLLNIFSGLLLVGSGFLAIKKIR